MRIYKVTCYDSDCGACLSWYASRTSATKALKDFQKERGGPAAGPEGVEEIDFPVRIAGVLAWLNLNFNRDNG